MTQPTAQELAEMVERLILPSGWGPLEDAEALLERWHHSQLVFVTTPREWSAK